MGKICGAICEVYSRCCGYFRPVSNWNSGKREEFKERKTFDVGKAKSDIGKTGNNHESKNNHH